MYILENDRLRVEVAAPGERPNLGFRFDRAGFIPEVVLDGNVHFCASEPQNLIHPSSGGRGLCFEYTADYSGEVEDGDYYPKLGVGLIRKEGPYSFCYPYRDVKPFPVDVSCGTDRIRFVTEPIACLGYAVSSVKEISIEGTTLTAAVTLENVGEREVVTREYCHNFLSIDGMAIAPDYRLDLPGFQGLKAGLLANQYPSEGNFLADESGISIARAQTAVSLSDVPFEGAKAASPFAWKLSHKGAKAYVEGLDEIRPVGITLWAVDHIFSAEILQEIVLKPGERRSWKRSWTFGTEY